MKKSNFLLFALLFSLTLVLVACATTTTTKKDDSTTSGQQTTEPISKNTDAPTDNVQSDSKTDEQKEVVHLQNFVRVLPDGAVTRTYNQEFDELVKDFSATSEANTFNRLRVVVDNLIETSPSTEDASIYKMATGTYEIHTYDGIGFKMRKLGEGTLDLSNLVLGLRGDDAWNLYELHLDEALDPDGDNLPELTDEFQDYIICPTLSIEDDTTEYKLRADSSNSGTKVLDKVLGFHLYLTGECAQVLEIEEVYLVKGADKTTLDNFSREKVNKTDATCWWRDSTGFIVQQGHELNGKPLTFDITNTTGANLVLNVMGDTTGVKINNVEWSNLKDNNGNAVVNAVNGAYHPIVINLEKSSLTKGEMTVTSTTDAYISMVFVSDLEEDQVVGELPLIDAAHASMFDNFNRTQSGFDGDYDKSAADPLVVEAGLYYALSYKNGDKVSIADGVLTFDATELEANDYINFKEGKNAYNGEHYLVLSVKATDGADFNNFRFNVGNEVVYVNQMVSAQGLGLPQADAKDYAYTDENGFMWLVIDLALSGMEPTDFIDFYYSGTGKLLIDCVFYADEVGRYVNYTETEVSKQGPFTVDTYVYSQGFTAGAKLVKIVFETESEDLDLSSIRFNQEGVEGDKWIKDSLVFDASGNPIDGSTKMKGASIVIDLEKTGFDYNSWVHMHAGSEGLTGSFSYTAYALSLPEESKFTETEVVAQGPFELGTYVYSQGFTAGTKLVKIVFETESEDLDLSSIRFNQEGVEGDKWIKDSLVFDASGNPIDGSTKMKGASIVIDLEKTGFDYNSWVHMHAGSEGLTGTFSYKAYALTEKAEYSEEQVSAQGPFTMGTYVYSQGFTAGTKLVKIVFETESEDLDLSSIRFNQEGVEGDKWIKDSLVFDASGNPIDGSTKMKGAEIVIDLEKTGFDYNSWVHMHAGSEGLTGSFSYKAYALKTADKYAIEMANLKQ